MEVQGKDALIFFNIDGTYVEFGCAETVGIERSMELIETTTEGTGYNKTFAGQSLSYFLNLSGLVLNESELVTVWDLFLQQENMFELPYRIVMTDVGGSIKTITGKVLVQNLTISADQTDLASSSFQLAGTGPITLTDAPAPIITIETTGEGIGAIDSLTLRTTDLSNEWAFVGSVGVGQTESWILDGVSGRPGPGEYYLEVVVSSDQPVNHFTVDAPPGANTVVGSGSTILDTAPFGNAVAFDFTQSRTITFNVGS